MMPNKRQIVEKAIELWRNDRVRANDPSFDLTPEIRELHEGGYLSTARSELMTNTETKNERWLNVDFPEKLTVDVKQLFESNGLILGSRHTGKSDIAMLVSDKAMLEKAVVVVFDPSLDWIVRSSIKQYVKVEPYAVLDIPTESVIYDVSFCSPQDQQRIVENFGKNLFEHQAQTSNRKQYLVIFEESHTYFYQGCMREQNMRNTVRLLSVGRNVNIAVMLISQFASMLDKFAIKHSTSQMWCGFTREPNDLKYLKQILGSEVEKLSKLEDGQFLYLTRNGLSKINIEPYESENVKTQIQIPRPSILPEQAQPKKPNQSVNIALAKVAVIAIFCLLMLKVYI